MSAGPGFPLEHGVFVAVVGPSGGGKDSLLRFARDRLDREAPGRVHFMRRVITRDADDGAESHESCSAARFADMRDRGAFALCWSAHGCAYGIPAEADILVREGRVVVANLSRGVLPQMRDRYRRTLAVEITAPLPVLARRIAARGRESGEAVEARLKRSERFCAPAVPYDLSIDNSGPLESGGTALADFLRRCLSAEPAI